MHNFSIRNYKFLLFLLHFMTSFFTFAMEKGTKDIEKLYSVTYVEGDNNEILNDEILIQITEVNLNTKDVNNILSYAALNNSRNLPPENIKMLHFTSNSPLQELPESLVLFKNIEELIVTNSGLESFGDFDFNKLEKLKILCLENNEITEIPYQLKKDIKGLESLSLSGNKITDPTPLDDLLLQVKINLSKNHNLDLGKLREMCDATLNHDTEAKLNAILNKSFLENIKSETRAIQTILAANYRSFRRLLYT